MYIGSEAVVIAGTKFKSNDENIIKDIVSQLEEAGFEVDAEVPSAKGKMEDFKKAVQYYESKMGRAYKAAMVYV